MGSHFNTALTDVDRPEDILEEKMKCDKCRRRWKDTEKAKRTRKNFKVKS